MIFFWSFTVFEIIRSSSKMKVIGHKRVWEGLKIDMLNISENAKNIPWGFALIDKFDLQIFSEKTKFIKFLFIYNIVELYVLQKSTSSLKTKLPEMIKNVHCTNRGLYVHYKSVY